MASKLFSFLFRRPLRAPDTILHFPFTLETNPYRCKRTWPPDFAQLSQKHQFRLERRYRRRSQLKWARPGWSKGVQLVQWASIVFVIFYGVLFLEVADGTTPFDGIREFYRSQMGLPPVTHQPRVADDNSPVASRQPS